MKILTLVVAILILVIAAGCSSTPSAGVNVNRSGGASTNAGWGPLSGSATTDGNFGLNIH